MRKKSGVSKMHKRVIDANKRAAGFTSAQVDALGDHLPEEEIPTLDFLKDSKIPENNYWDSCNEFYQNNMAAILQAHHDVLGVIKSRLAIPQISEKIENDPVLAGLIHTLGSDIQGQIDRMNEIYTQHEGKSGSANTADECMAVIQINSSYGEVNEAFTAIHRTTISSIMQKLGVYDAVIEEILKAKADTALANAQDPNIITDAIIMETPNAAQ